MLIHFWCGKGTPQTSVWLYDLKQKYMYVFKGQQRPQGHSLSYIKGQRDGEDVKGKEKLLASGDVGKVDYNEYY